MTQGGADEDVLQASPHRVEPVDGRLAMFAGFSAAAQAIPVPLLPERFLGRIRGAVAHETATRHGISITADARAILAAPVGDAPGGWGLGPGLAFVARRVWRRLGPVSSVVRAFEVYAFGHLLERYFLTNRGSLTLRVLPAEAAKLRHAIDVATLRAFGRGVHGSGYGSREVVDDFRDDLTRWIDAALVAGATLPSLLQRRLDAAFDQAIAEALGGDDARTRTESAH